EDDSRNWTKDRKRLLANLLHPKQRGKIAQHDDEIDWQRVGDLAHSPRAVPVPVTGDGGGGDGDGVDAVVAQGLLVQNTVPEGSNWDGQSGLLLDEKTFNDLLNGRDKAPVGIP
ncbi:MAG TPA: hypothetical protein VK523_09295, partial [Steroidobacteraceae bacterium]|nr:hypothetical protein [Steroidobacteraceae bacterium]